MVALAVVGAALSLTVGPGPVDAVVHVDGYAAHVRMAPNRSLRAGTVSLSLSKNGQPVEGARVRATVTMLDMNMGTFTLALHRTGFGRYSTADPAVGMPGRWGWRIVVRPRGAPSFEFTLVDRIRD